LNYYSRYLPIAKPESEKKDEWLDFGRQNLPVAIWLFIKYCLAEFAQSLPPHALCRLIYT